MLYLLLLISSTPILAMGELFEMADNVSVGQVADVIYSPPVAGLKSGGDGTCTFAFRVHETLKGKLTPLVVTGDSSSAECSLVKNHSLSDSPTVVFSLSPMKGSTFRSLPGLFSACVRRLRRPLPPKSRLSAQGRLAFALSDSLSLELDQTSRTRIVDVADYAGWSGVADLVNFLASKGDSNTLSKLTSVR